MPASDPDVRDAPGAAPLLTQRVQPNSARRRLAPRAQQSSDVTRFRGLALATAAAAVFVIGFISISTRGAALRAPGPLARPHQLAKLECASCHKLEPPTKACAGCHGPHPSTRAGHRKLSASGELNCASCHQIHRANEGITFLPGGKAIRYGSGWERPSDNPTNFHPDKPLSVPLVRREVCARCHDASSPRDPLAACLTESAATAQSVVCFDEHRRVTTPGKGGKRVSAVTESRDAAWEAARAVVAAEPARIQTSQLLSPLGWVGGGLGFGATILALVFVATRRKARKQAASPPLVRPNEVVRLPRINPITCLGCYACVDACPYDVLEVKEYVAVVVRPNDCCGLTLCEQRCPNGSLVVEAGELLGDRPNVSDDLESPERPGLYLAGDLTGLPLIRNAINQGAHAVRAIKVGLEGSASGVLDLVIVGAGPAGISAALTAKQLGLSYLVLEQGSVAESIKSFPRGKLVFDQPLGMPLIGELWLEESSKEELLGKWLRIVRREALQIREGQRVDHVEPEAGGPPLGRFVVHSLSSDGAEHEFRARRVLLAVGRRGSPRKLPLVLPGAAEAKVHYSLADARSFRGARVVIVGLGDVAMETAIALARQPDTEVTLSYRGDQFRRGKSRNISEVQRLIQAGRIQLIWQSQINAVDETTLTLEAAGKTRRLDYDALFVMIGSIPPWGFLERAGVQRAGG